MSRDISKEELTPFIKGDGLSGLAKALLLQQKSTWQQLKKGYDSLKGAEIKIFNFNGFQLKAQFNKERILSASAKVDKASIKNRKCFLCEKNLPLEQKGIKFNDNYLILANPFPIFNEHFTIASLKHQPQRIGSHFEEMLLLTKELGDSFVVFYNGPASGASAPDHLHFQAGNLGFLPLDYEKEKLLKKNIFPLKTIEESRIFYSKKYLRNFILLESNSFRQSVQLFNEIMEILSLINPHEDETMLNIIAYYRNDVWQVFLFPREKHRPDFYFLEEPERIIFSPAAVDFGGVCIFPREADFDRITKVLLTKAFAQVTITQSKYERLLNMLK